MNLLIVLFFLIFSGISTAATLNDVVVFGDSLSDNGNLFEYKKHEVPDSPPYYAGRFSNGPVWVEQLTETYFPNKGQAHLQDYAFGGAGVFNNKEDKSWFELKNQVNSYLLAHHDVASPKSLFIIWIGANNYFSMPMPIEDAVHEVNKGIRAQLKRLARKGARHIMVINLPDLGRIPASHLLSMEKELTESTLLHNDALNDSLMVLRRAYSNVHWMYFDAKAALDKVLNNPEKFHFINSTEPCDELTTNKSYQSVNVVAMASQLKALSRPHDTACDGYLFFDPVHTTVQGHRLLAQHVRHMLKKEGIAFK